MLASMLASALFREQSHNQHIIHYLDDFLVAGPPHSTTCADSFSSIEHLCQQLGVATKPEKSTPPTTSITFLGVQLDTISQVASLPQEKLVALLDDLGAFSILKKCQKRALLSLIGKLAFAAKAIPAGRIFIRRLIDASTRVSRPYSPNASDESRHPPVDPVHTAVEWQEFFPR